MARTRFMVKRFQRIQLLFREGFGIRQTVRALNVSRRVVREVGSGKRLSPDSPKAITPSPWMKHVDWAIVLGEQAVGTPLKDIWREHAHAVTMYSSFWKQMQPWFPANVNPGPALHVIGVSPRLSLINTNRDAESEQPGARTTKPRHGKRRSDSKKSPKRGNRTDRTR